MEGKLTDRERFLAAVAGDAVRRCNELRRLTEKLVNDLARTEARLAQIETLAGRGRRVAS